MKASNQLWIKEGTFEGILVLGESAYKLKEDPLPSDCIGALLKWLKWKNGSGEKEKFYRWMHHFMKIQQVVSGQRIHWSDPLAVENGEKFFSEIAYTNYILKPVGNKPSAQPREEQWKDAESRLEQLLQEKGSKPERILVLGKRLWEHILNANQKIISEYPDGSRYFVVKSDSGIIPICAIPHPSYWNRCRPRYTAEDAHAHFIKESPPICRLPPNRWPEGLHAFDPEECEPL